MTKCFENLIKVITVYYIMSRLILIIVSDSFAIVFCIEPDEATINW